MVIKPYEIIVEPCSTIEYVDNIIEHAEKS